MATQELELSLLSRFQGVSLGALFGDCLGAKFETNWSVLPYEKVISYYETIKDKVAMETPKADSGFVHYTDDTCMTFDLAKSLTKNRKYKPQDVAKRFTETFFASPKERNYGRHVAKVFSKLKENSCRGDVYKPASEQFGGSGSYGNGSAMRVSPVALLHHDNIIEMLTLVVAQSKLTHTNPRGINGAVLQALAIEKAMTSGKIDNAKIFCQELLDQFKEITPIKEDMEIFENGMSNVMELLEKESEVTPREIVSKLGTGVLAIQAVPPAIFFFLHSLKTNNVPTLSTYNGMVRTVLYATSVSHDSDTVACMAGAIAGAYYGVDSIPSEWVTACEGSDKAMKLANKLYKMNENSRKNKKS
uniref:ADP-ribose glycohydrolase ARH3-like n=1 Tax=Styela clava TaxID=7725 RepID=UPI001939C91B|nr:ADP-ribose glycohydrolase ARH3-like [Styela clava]